MLWKLLSMLVPNSVKARARRWVRLVAGKPSMNSILATLHDPLTVEDRGDHFVPSRKHAGQTVHLESGLPLPTVIYNERGVRDRVMDPESLYTGIQRLTDLHYQIVFEDYDMISIKK